MSNERASERHTHTVFGRPVYLTPIRTYTPPADIDWAARSFSMFFGLFYNDPVIAGQFRAFYLRTSLSVVMGTAYALCFLLTTFVPLATYKYQSVWGTTSALLTVTMSIDLSLHLFAPVSPKVATVRMVTSFVIGMLSIVAVGWSFFAVNTECGVSWQLPDFPGRLNLSLDDQRWLCVRIFDPNQTAAIILGSLGVLLYPLAHVALAVLHLVLVLNVGRQVATGPFAHEEHSEIAMEALMSVACCAGAIGITCVRFSSATSAFEATIRVEVQRREAAARAAELHKLLHTIVPAAVLPRLEVGGPSQHRIDHVASASMLFADMKGFTAWSSSRTATQVTSMLNTIVADLDTLAVGTDAVEKVKTVGDAYWAVAGIPVQVENHADQLVLFGWRMNAVVAGLSEKHAEWGGVAWRVGIHTGPMTGALFGDRQVSYEVFGETSQITQVVEANGVPGAVVATERTLSSLLVRPDDNAIHVRAEIPDGLDNAGTLTLFELLPPAELRVGDVHSLTQSASATPGASLSASRRGSLVASPRSSVDHRPSAPVVVADSLFSNPVPVIPDHARLALENAHAIMECAPPGARTGAKTRVPLRDRRVSYEALREMTFTHVSEAPGYVITPQSSVGDHRVGNEVEDQTAGDSKCHATAQGALEEAKWPLLPYFMGDDTEALFKRRAEEVCRNMNRVCSTLLLAVHGVHMLTLAAMPDRCFHPIGVPLQAAAVVPFVIAIACALHPSWSLQVSSLALFVAASVGMIGTGLTPLNGCVVGHDLQSYAWVSFACLFFSVGPVSWPVILAFSVSFIMVPGIVLSAFFSPIAPPAIALFPFGCVIALSVSFTEERLLRRRFVEEEIARRGNIELAALGEQRVAVLRRLVPEHVVSDLIVWFGLSMDPDRSITRSYRQVVIAFLQLRPEALDALPVLHAEVDAELLRICGRDVAHSDEAAPQPPAKGSDAETRANALKSDLHPIMPRGLESGATSVLDKIKTVGDIVMVAGPFPHGGAEGPSAHTSQVGDSAAPSLSQAYIDSSAATINASDAEIAAALSAVVDLFTSVRSKCPVQVGAHLGPVVGTVQGSSRLAFDIFGNAVNIASRVLTCAPGRGSRMHVSSALADAAGPSTSNVEFGPPATVTAKGKGSLSVRSVSLS